MYIVWTCAKLQKLYICTYFSLQESFAYGFVWSSLILTTLEIKPAIFRLLSSHLLYIEPQLLQMYIHTYVPTYILRISSLFLSYSLTFCSPPPHTHSLTLLSSTPSLSFSLIPSSSPSPVSHYVWLSLTLTLHMSSFCTIYLSFLSVVRWDMYIVHIYVGTNIHTTKSTVGTAPLCAWVCTRNWIIFVAFSQHCRAHHAILPTVDREVLHLFQQKKCQSYRKQS
jgi:hypothetical protein